MQWMHGIKEEVTLLVAWTGSGAHHTGCYWGWPSTGKRGRGGRVGEHSQTLRRMHAGTEWHARRAPEARKGSFLVFKLGVWETAFRKIRLSKREELDLRVQEPEQEQEHATKHPRVTKVLPEKMSFSFITLRSLLDLLTAALSMICSGL